MAVQLDFSGAEAQRLKITREQQEHIRDLYRQASAEVGKLAEQAPRVPSDALRQQYLHTLQSQIDEQLRDIESQLNGTIRSGMTDTVKATVDDAKSFLKENGLPIKGAYSHVPADIVRSVASGQLYTGNWTLSKALWLNTKETQQDVQSIVAQGIIQNKSAYDIAKDLEKYVNPDARKDWNWSKVYPGTKKVVDYNAQRLARTMVSHAYQQAFVRTTQKNPFVSKYKWEASNSGRVCEICEERDGKLFDKDDLPLDHPNGMCTFTAVMDNLEKIGERLGDWAVGKSDPELDKWAEDLYGKDWEQKKEEVQTKQGNMVDGRNIVDTWQRRSNEFAFEIEDVINAQGFDGLPRVVSKQEFDALKSQSNIIGFRGYSAPDSRTLEAYKDQLYNGKWYVDCTLGTSVYGQGMYVQGVVGSVKDNDQMIAFSKMLADGYAAPTRFYNSETAIGRTENVLLDRSARGTYLFEHPPVQGKKEDLDSPIRREFLSQNKYSDIGSFIASKGYDYYYVYGECKTTQEVVVLNRTKVIFSGD